MMIQKLKTVESYFFTLLDWLTPSFGCFADACKDTLRGAGKKCFASAISSFNYFVDISIIFVIFALIINLYIKIYIMNFWDILMILEFIRHPKRMMRFCTIVIVGAIFLAACMHTLKEGISINSDDIPMIIAVAIIMILGLVLITPKRKSNCNKNSEKK